MVKQSDRSTSTVTRLRAPSSGKVCETATCDENRCDEVQESLPRGVPNGSQLFRIARENQSAPSRNANPIKPREHLAARRASFRARGAPAAASPLRDFADRLAQ